MLYTVMALVFDLCYLLSIDENSASGKNQICIIVNPGTCEFKDTSTNDQIAVGVDTVHFSSLFHQDGKLSAVEFYCREIPGGFVPGVDAVSPGTNTGCAAINYNPGCFHTLFGFHGQISPIDLKHSLALNAVAFCPDRNASIPDVDTSASNVIFRFHMETIFPCFQIQYSVRNQNGAF